jgi:hypothetical protein
MLTKKLSWALPGIVFVGAFTMSAACGSDGPVLPTNICPNNNNTSDGAGTSGAGGSTSSGDPVPTPQEVGARLHGCRKVRYASLGNVLADRGVDLSSTAANSAGLLYAMGEDAFSVPKIDSRRGEKDGHTTASAMKLFDIFVQAAPEIIANISNSQLAPACTLNGQNPEMFASDGSCVEEAVSCLLGYPASEDHMLLCNLIVDKADPTDSADVANKRHIAVATLLSAAHSCE